MRWAGAVHLLCVRCLQNPSRRIREACLTLPLNSLLPAMRQCIMNLLLQTKAAAGRYQHAKGHQNRDAHIHPWIVYRMQGAKATV